MEGTRDVDAVEELPSSQVANFCSSGYQTEAMAKAWPAASLAANYNVLEKLLPSSGRDGSGSGSFCIMARAVGVYFYLTAYRTKPSGCLLCRHKVGVGLLLHFQRNYVVCWRNLSE